MADSHTQTNIEEIRNYNVEGGKKVAYIFNHFKFMEDYAGTIEDTVNRDLIPLSNCFIKMGFELHVYRDRKKNDIERVTNEIAALDKNEVSCVAVAVTTHGDSGGILCASDDAYESSEITTPIIRSNTLAGVPKIFIFQACRGGNDTPLYRIISKSVPTDDTASPSEDDEVAYARLSTSSTAGMRSLSSQAVQQSSPKSGSKITIKNADYIKIYATFEETVAWKYWLTEVLCAKLDSYWDRNKDVAEILTLVNNAIVQRNTQYQTQMSQIESTLSKRLQFNR